MLDFTLIHSSQENETHDDELVKVHGQTDKEKFKPFNDDSDVDMLE